MKVWLFCFIFSLEAANRVWMVQILRTFLFQDLFLLLFLNFIVFLFYSTLRILIKRNVISEITWIYLEQRMVIELVNVSSLFVIYILVLKWQIMNFIISFVSGLYLGNRLCIWESWMECRKVVKEHIRSFEIRVDLLVLSLFFLFQIIFFIFSYHDFVVKNQLPIPLFDFYIKSTRIHGLLFLKTFPLITIIWLCVFSKII